MDEAIGLKGVRPEKVAISLRAWLVVLVLWLLLQGLLVVELLLWVLLMLAARKKIEVTVQGLLKVVKLGVSVTRGMVL